MTVLFLVTKHTCSFRQRWEFFICVCVDLLKVSGDFTQHSGRLFQPCPMEMHSNVNDGDVNTGWLLGTRPNNVRIDFGQVRNV